MQVIRSATPQESAGQALTAALKVQSGRPILLLVSGGSAFGLLDFVDPTVLSPSVTLSVLDERFSTDPIINNFAQLEQTQFFDRAVGAGVVVLSTKVVEGDSLAAAHARFDAALHAWRTEHSDGVVIVTMGIGPDGHTAGIFAGEYGVDWNTVEWSVAYTVPVSVNPYSDRITVTDTFLTTQVNEAIVYAVGVEKQTFVDQLQQSVCNRTTMPACIICHLPVVTLVTKER